MQHIPEKGWKHLKALQGNLLAAACERIFDKIDRISLARKGREHESYLELWKMLHDEDADISLMFDDLKRSTAMMKLASWKAHNLLSDQDLEGFTQETQNRIRILSEM